MKEKDGLDKRIFVNNWVNVGKEFYNNNRSRKKTIEKVAKFNENAGKCKDIVMKEKEPKMKVYWCKIIDKPCKYLFCPKIEK